MNTLPNPLHGDWADSMADWSASHQKLTERDLDRFIADREPLDTLPFPILNDEPTEAASACSEFLADPEREQAIALARLKRWAAVGVPLMVALGAAGWWVWR